VEVHSTTPNDNIVKNKKSNQEEEKINIIKRKPEKIEIHKITKIQ
jgi:hypothetical protein